MSRVTIELTEERFGELRRQAEACGLSAEDLVRACVEDLLAGPDEEVQAAIRYVINKNRDLYRRLA